MRECKWEGGTAERTVRRNCGMRSCSRSRIGAVCATWPKPWPEMETTRWGIALASLTGEGVQAALQDHVRKPGLTEIFQQATTCKTLRTARWRRGRCPFPAPPVISILFFLAFVFALADAVPRVLDNLFDLRIGKCVLLGWH